MYIFAEFTFNNIFYKISNRIENTDSLTYQPLINNSGSWNQWEKNIYSINSAGKTSYPYEKKNYIPLSYTKTNTLWMKVLSIKK